MNHSFINSISDKQRDLSFIVPSDFSPLKPLDRSHDFLELNSKKFDYVRKDYDKYEEILLSIDVKKFNSQNKID